MRVLCVLTSNSQLGKTGAKTGFWIEEFAAPYYALTNHGVEVTLATPKGGMPPIDPKSDLPENQLEATKRFHEDEALQTLLKHTTPLSKINAEEFDAIFFPGGHGPLWDLHSDADSIRLVEEFYNSGKPVGAVCHGPTALLNARKSNGEPLVKGHKVTSFSNEEEEAMELTKVVPHSIETRMKELGGHYVKGESWSDFSVRDGLLITGQNPASSVSTAEELLKALGQQSRKAA